METLPNIDINIKCGNSLISRYGLDADIRQALKKSKWSIDSYRNAVMTYRNAQTKDQKKDMQRLIDTIKQDFETEVAANDKRVVSLRKQKDDLFNLTQQTSLFERSKKELAEWNKKVNDLTAKIKKLEAELEEIKNNKIYENAFEWRFEFPEVLNDEGDFVGFDVVIGNPPYISSKEFSESLMDYLNANFSTSQYQLDLYVAFLERGVNILKSNGAYSFITPNSWLKNMTFSKCRSFLIQNLSFINIFPNLENVFEEGSVDTLIFIATKHHTPGNLVIY